MLYSRTSPILRILSLLPTGMLLWLATTTTLLAQVDFTSSNLPIVVIDTRGQERSGRTQRGH